MLVARSLVSALALSACASPAQAPTSSPSLAVQLAQRHADSSCAKLAEAAGGVDALRDAAETLTMPPWAPLRAATCLAELAPERASAAAVRWVQQPERVGLGLAVLQVEARLSATDAQAIAEAALTGPRPELVRPILARSERASLRALVP